MSKSIQNIDLVDISDKRLNRALLLATSGTVLAVFLLFFNVILSLALMQLSSKLNVIPYLLFDKPRLSSEMVSREVFDRSMSSLKEICRVYVQKFVEMRYGHYKDEEYMKYLWGYSGLLKAISHPQTYDAFYVSQKVFDRRLLDMHASSRRVIIHKIAPYRENPRHWVVNFSIAEKSDTAMIHEHNMIKMDEEIFTISFSRRRIRMEGDILNPLGIMIADRNAGGGS